MYFNKFYIGKYKSVCTYLDNFNAIEISYNILNEYQEQEYICNIFILFLNTVLETKYDVVDVCE